MKIFGPPRYGIPQLDRKLELGLIISCVAIVIICLLAIAFFRLKGA